MLYSVHHYKSSPKEKDISTIATSFDDWEIVEMSDAVLPRIKTGRVLDDPFSFPFT